MENEEVKIEELKTETPKKSNTLPVVVIVIALLVFGGLYLSKNKPQVNAPSGTETETTQTSTTIDASKAFSLDEVSNHSTREDCWLVIEDGVYDVTSFAPKHPGEEAIFFGCGKDATEMFNKRQDGTSHSDRARVQLEKLKIGVLSSS